MGNEGGRKRGGEGGREGRREGGAYQGIAVRLSEPGKHEADAGYVVVGGANEGKETLDGVLSARGGGKGGVNEGVNIRIGMKRHFARWEEKGEGRSVCKNKWMNMGGTHHDDSDWEGVEGGREGGKEGGRRTLPPARLVESQRQSSSGGRLEPMLHKEGLEASVNTRVKRAVSGWGGGVCQCRN